MQQNKCDKCKKPANTQCGQCKCVYYCSRDCQKLAWNGHKSICKDLSTYGLEGLIKRKNDMFIESAIKKIGGNVLMSASHKHDCLQSVNVTLNETIDSFTSSINHCAYITTNRTASEGDDIKNNNDGSLYNKLVVNVSLYDYFYSTTMTVPDYDWFLSLREKNEDPGDDWPVFFDMSY